MEGKLLKEILGKLVPSQIPKVGKLDPSAKELSRTIQNTASNEFTTGNLLETKSVSSLSGKVDSNLYLGSSKQVQTLNLDKLTSDDAGNKKNLAASTKVSDGENGVTKANGGAKNIDRNDFVESGKSSLCRGSTSTGTSDESSCSSFSSSVNKPHKANDLRWEATQAVQTKDGVLDISIFKLTKAYMWSSPLRKAALIDLSKTLTVDELFYLKEQFAMLEPNKNGTISLDNIKAAGFLSILLIIFLF